MRVSRVSLGRGRVDKAFPSKYKIRIQNETKKEMNNGSAKKWKRTQDQRNNSLVSSTLPVSPSLSSSPRAAARALFSLSTSLTLLNAISCFNFIGGGREGGERESGIDGRRGEGRQEEEEKEGLRCIYLTKNEKRASYPWDLWGLIR